MIALTIIRIENSYGRLMGFENKENQIIKIEQLKQIEESYLRRIKEVLTSETILEINRFSNAFDLWKLLDEEGSNKYIKDVFQDYAKKNLDKFSELELIKLATFVLNYGKDDRIYGVNEEQAAKLVEEWKKSQ